MLVFEFIGWWYTRGFARLANTLQGLIATVWYTFSIPILIKTLFAPWKRIQTDHGKSLQSHLQALIDNLVSRAVGFTIRLFTMIAGFVCIVLILVFSLIILIAWPFLPIAWPALIAWGLL